MAVQRFKIGDAIIEHDYDSLPDILPHESHAPEFWTVVRRTSKELFVWQPCGRCGGCTYLGLNQPYGPVMVVVKRGMLRSSLMGHAAFLEEGEDLRYEDVLKMASGISVGIAFNYEGDKWDVLPFVAGIGRTD